MAGTLLSSRVPCQWPPCALSMAALVPDGAGDAYSVAPSPTPRTTLAGSDSGPLRKALLLPLGASTTALPVPLQLLSADWILDVSGGDDSALLLNCSLLVASVALSVLHADGTDGWLTERLSPVASVSAVAALAGDDAKTAGTTAAPAPRMRADAASAPVRAFTCPATAGMRAITEFSSLTGRDGSAHAQPSPSAGGAATAFRGCPRPEIAAGRAAHSESHVRSSSGQGGDSGHAEPSPSPGRVTNAPRGEHAALTARRDAQPRMAVRRPARPAHGEARCVSLCAGQGISLRAAE